MSLMSDIYSSGVSIISRATGSPHALSTSDCTRAAYVAASAFARYPYNLPVNERIIPVLVESTCTKKSLVAITPRNSSCVGGDSIEPDSNATPLSTNPAARIASSLRARTLVLSNPPTAVCDVVLKLPVTAVSVPAIAFGGAKSKSMASTTKTSLSRGDRLKSI